ncbi:MAG: tRNA (guanosine(37)-N1)-methyltransferase TrmD [Candidatus Jorgensenbacteria bacterium]
MITFHIITIFPEAIETYLRASVLGRAEKRGILKFDLVNLRPFGLGKHHVVDNPPYGGGAGMVIKIEPVFRAVQFLRSKISAKGGSAVRLSSPSKSSGGKNQKSKRTRVILFSTRGKVFDQKAARRLARYDHLILVAGRYEGVDERVAKHVADEEISIGEFVLSGGELPALVVTEAVARHIPGVLGKQESLEEWKGSYPTYTKPEVFVPDSRRKGTAWRVPKVLLSGDHKNIAAWRQKMGK